MVGPKATFEDVTEWASYGDSGDEACEGRLRLRRGEGSEEETWVRIVGRRRHRTGKVAWYATNTTTEAFSPAEVPDAGFARWPLHENRYREAYGRVGLDRHHGYGKRLIANVDDVHHPVLVLVLPRSLFVHRSPGGYFRRPGSSKRQMPPDALARLFQHRRQARLIRFDEQVVPEARFADLDEPRWRRFIGVSNRQPRETLHKMSLVARDPEGEERATVAGVLLCSPDPTRWLPNAYIQAVSYRGTRQNSNDQLDAADLGGPLDEQVEAALLFVRRNMRMTARKHLGRVDYPPYDMRAVFEAVVNAVAHRDYSVHGSRIRLFLFTDRLELYSPGALPNTVSVESLALRQATRNELVTSLLARIPVDDPSGELDRHLLMEKRGEGVPLIIEWTRALSGQDPSWRLIDEAELLLTLPAALPPGGAGGDRRRE